MSQGKSYMGQAGSGSSTLLSESKDIVVIICQPVPFLPLHVDRLSPL